MRDAVTVLEFLAAAQARGERTALVALAGIAGTASRKLGTLFGVSESGWCGSLSGGCIEAAVAAEARRAIAAGKAAVLRLGKGSPLIDIRLPCGGGLDLVIVPDPATDAISMALGTLARREPVLIEAALDGRLSAAGNPARGTGFDGEVLGIRIEPLLRIVAIGQGEELVALARQAVAFGAETIALTSDEPAERSLSALDVETHPLRGLGPSPHLASDAWTAIVLLFHDHDWEQALLRQAIELPALLIGAMGSRRTHAERIARLAAAGAPEEKLARIRGPIGLIEMTRDPATLALSVLAEVAAVYHARCEAAGNHDAPGSLRPAYATHSIPSRTQHR